MNISAASSGPFTNALTNALPAVSMSAVSSIGGDSQADPDLKYLTASDRELVFQATGVRLTDDSKGMPIFAVQLAMERKNGGFSGQDVSVDFLRGLAQTYSDSRASQSMGPQIDAALDDLVNGTKRIDFTA